MRPTGCVVLETDKCHAVILILRSPVPDGLQMGLSLLGDIHPLPLFTSSDPWHWLWPFLFHCQPNNRLRMQPVPSFLGHLCFPTCTPSGAAALTGDVVLPAIVSGSLLKEVFADTLEDIRQPFEFLVGKLVKKRSGFYFDTRKFLVKWLLKCRSSFYLGEMK